MTARRALLLFRLWAAVLLATIGLQALEPVSAPLHRLSGSAFSAATADVALVSVRRSEAPRAPVLPTPALPTPQMAIERLPSPAFAPEPERLQPGARAPPPRQASERLPDLRGPPLA